MASIGSLTGGSMTTTATRTIDLSEALRLEIPPVKERLVPATFNLPGGGRGWVSHFRIQRTDLQYYSRKTLPARFRSHGSSFAKQTRNYPTWRVMWQVSVQR